MGCPPKFWDGRFALKNPKVAFSATCVRWGRGALSRVPWETPVLRWASKGPARPRAVLTHHTSQTPYMPPRTAQMPG